MRSALESRARTGIPLRVSFGEPASSWEKSTNTKQLTRMTNARTDLSQLAHWSAVSAAPLA
jgi:hypothetical protein